MVKKTTNTLEVLCEMGINQETTSDSFTKEKIIQMNNEMIANMLGQNDRHFEEERNCASNKWTSSDCSGIKSNSRHIETSKSYFAFRENPQFCDSQSLPNSNLDISLCCDSENLGSEMAHKSSFSNSNCLSYIFQGFRRKSYRNFCLFSVFIAFGLGLILGIFLPLAYGTKDVAEHSAKLVLSNMTEYQNLIMNGTTDSFSVQKTNGSATQQTSKSKSGDAFERIFLVNSNHVGYRRAEVKFPTINDFSDENKSIQKGIEKHTAINLVKPKRYPSVSFLDNENMEVINSETNEDKSFTDSKYLSLDNNGYNSNDTDDQKNKTKSMDHQLISGDFINDNETILYKNIYWGEKIEKSLPPGYGSQSNDEWIQYMKTTSAVKMETGCGRMQNRLVTFLDGRQACVRYRQNTDQIQGELFSFYLGQVLNLPNLAPSLISLVNLTENLWQNVANDIGSAQWNSNRPVVMTKYIPNLESAHIPPIFKPSERHLNKFDVVNIIKKGSDPDDLSTKSKGDYLLKKLTKPFLLKNDENDSIKTNDEVIVNDYSNQNNFDKKEEPVVEHVKAKIGEDLLDKFVELAQWSDLIVFDYLTANLDRIVNNLYNFQWNVNIMDAPAHNLARKVDSNLLLFLDNESGLLHGYRLLNKYEVYHTLLLDNLCVFRRSTADAIKNLHKSRQIGNILDRMFKEKNEAGVLDVLPPLPEKSVKILNERIARVAGQIKRCEDQFGR